MSIGNLKDTGNQGNNFPWQLKVLQGLQGIFDEVSQPLTCVEDSVTICNENIDAFTFSVDAGIDSLNVHITNPIPLEVNLDAANDQVGIYGYVNGASGSPVPLNVSSTGNPNTNVHDGSGNALTSTVIGADTGLDVNIIGGVTLEVNLDQNNDQVQVYGSDLTNPIKTDAAGELQIDVLTMPATFAEDSAHVSGNIGAFVMGVRNDSNAAMTSANGDYSPIAVNDKGAVAIQDGGGSLTVDGTVALDAPTLAALESITVQNGAGASAVNIQDGGNSITVDGGTGVQRTPTFLRPAGTNGTIPANVFAVSLASVGTADAIVGGVALKPGETINLDGGAINNTLASITYNTSTNAGAELLITYLL